ncbi:hypothetical protein [Microbulbifer guangxiensis]|uniref:hypothetical protein n=1 Tax=Microbulbifer guangxiensis TaxID=2904249 RepID=UPI001F18BA6B|nr:hypothetical protein [Microbulbifer guangxiensis]
MRKTIFLSLLLLATSASADSLTKQMRGCASIQSDKERLGCYDALSKSLDERAEQNFGQEQKRIVEEAPEQITAQISEVQEGAYGKAIITLDNGQVWRQNDSGRVRWSAGDRIVVERGLFGSFFMKPAQGGRKIRVKRER